MTHNICDIWYGISLNIFYFIQINITFNGRTVSNMVNHSMTHIIRVYSSGSASAQLCSFSVSTSFSDIPSCMTTGVALLCISFLFFFIYFDVPEHIYYNLSSWSSRSTSVVTTHRLCGIGSYILTIKVNNHISIRYNEIKIELQIDIWIFLNDNLHKTCSKISNIENII